MKFIENARSNAGLGLGPRVFAENESESSGMIAIQAFEQSASLT